MGTRRSGTILLGAVFCTLLGFPDRGSASVVPLLHAQGLRGHFLEKGIDPVDTSWGKFTNCCDTLVSSDPD